MFEHFSGSYYLGRLYVAPTDGDRALMAGVQHERVNRELYATGEGIERLDRPLVMKLDSTHFRVHGDEGVPANTLEVPAEFLEESTIRDAPRFQGVLLARRERARQLIEFGAG